jgi:aspartyl protease family protein
MTKSGGVYEIPVILNESIKLNFIFDAGASDVSISPDVALTLIRTGTLTDEDFIGTETYKFADGSKAKSKVFEIKEVQIGDKKVFNVRASISNSISAPLLLGQSVLNKFGRVTIDYKNGVIIFQN